MESTIELLAESQYHFIWRVDEIIKSSIEFSWDFELESDNVKTNFFYTVDLNGNKVLTVKMAKASTSVGFKFSKSGSNSVYGVQTFFQSKHF